jgi:hypothetical protein
VLNQRKCKTIDDLLDVLNDDTINQKAAFTFEQMVKYASAKMDRDSVLMLLKALEKIMGPKHPFHNPVGILYGLAADNIYPKPLVVDHDVFGIADSMKRGKVVVKSDVEQLGDILGGEVFVKGDLDYIYQIRGGSVTVDGDIKLINSAHNARITARGEIGIASQLRPNPRLDFKGAYIQAGSLSCLDNIGGVVICDNVKRLHIPDYDGSNKIIEITNTNNSLTTSENQKMIMEYFASINKSKNNNKPNIFVARNVDHLSEDMGGLTLFTKNIESYDFKHWQEIEQVRLDGLSAKAKMLNTFKKLRSILMKKH